MDTNTTPETALVVSHTSFLMVLINEVLLKETTSYDVTGWNHELGSKLIGNANYFVVNVERGEGLDSKRKVHFAVVRGHEHLKELRKEDVLTSYTRDGGSLPAKVASCVQQ